MEAPTCPDVPAIHDDVGGTGFQWLAELLDKTTRPDVSGLYSGSEDTQCILDSPRDCSWYCHRHRRRAGSSCRPTRCELMPMSAEHPRAPGPIDCAED